MKKINLIISSATGFITSSMSMFASTCGIAGGACGTFCGTTAVSLFGLSSGTTGVLISEWQPIFIGVSILAFSYSFYSLYFRKSKAVNCSTDASCEACQPKKMSTVRYQKLFLWAALLVSIGFYSYASFANNKSSTNETLIDNKCSETICEQKIVSNSSYNIYDCKKLSKCTSNSTCNNVIPPLKTSNASKLKNQNSCDDKLPSALKSSTCDPTKVCLKPCSNN